MSFWDEMELWQQMLFVLACAMVAVLMLGCSKLMLRRIQLRKLKKHDVEKAQMEETASEANLQDGEIPFGIRALEAGVEVEGVVVSRPTSPRPSHHNTSSLTLVEGTSSLKSLLNSSPSESPQGSFGPQSASMAETFNHNVQYPILQQLRPVYQPNPYNGAPIQGAASSTTIKHYPSNNSSPAHTRNPSVENVPTLTEYNTARAPVSVRGPSPVPLTYASNRIAAMVNNQRRSTSQAEGSRQVQPNVYGPSSRSPSPLEASILPSVLENPAPSSRDSYSSRLGKEDEVQTNSGGDSPSEFASVEGKEDLSLMHTHRLSHAAEVGQLARRPPGPVRRSTSSGTSTVTPPSPTAVVLPTTLSPVFSVDIAMPEGSSMQDSIEQSQSQRRSLSTFQHNQNVEIARELYPQRLAAQPVDIAPVPTEHQAGSSVEEKKTGKCL
ncbi:hypothetical protein BDZ91DRAFT_275825 [Kalaharituber pfeilii]|nr:hypothetical protein BDZ91DRAFT_275825 [Kalaharituber pfeilii]